MEFIDRSTYMNDIGIYGIKNKINGKVYVGQTREKFKRRFWLHRWKLNDGSHDNKHLQYAYNKYGSDNFEFFILKKVNKEDIFMTEGKFDYIDTLEIYFIDLYKFKNICYNIASGGRDNFGGCFVTPEGRKATGEKNRQRILGTKLSDETRKRMSETHRKNKELYISKRQDRANVVLNCELVSTIKSMIMDGVSLTEISETLGVTYNSVNGILSNNVWADVVVEGWDEFQCNRKTYDRLLPEDHDEMFRLYKEESMTIDDFVQVLGFDVRYVRKILRRYTDL